MHRFAAAPTLRWGPPSRVLARSSAARWKTASRSCLPFPSSFANDGHYRLFCSRPSNVQIIESVSEMRQARKQMGEKCVGFVPTMGALHEGHLSLAREASSECDEVVVSIFVNPTQFAPGEDLDKYPRDLDGDIKKLSDVEKVTTVFFPSVQEMYPQDGADVFVGVDNIEDRLAEGQCRPGHFRGVATVVTKLFNIVQPTKAYFGQKDGGQCILIRKVVEELKIDTKIQVVPTKREEDGLAMSSRNMYLSDEERPHAAVLFKALKSMEQEYSEGLHSAGHLLDVGKSVISEDNKTSLLYLDVSYADNGKPLENDEIELAIAP
eukprot:CAMPEP_0114493542 /NCGR_PEP_ID=MMETSP0109-20121206/4164_1 /TAXON_ID=29199 /ORGANISM="Chlorarachnion reptans, Strain CCCM449" /LENGTH=321 /DNA_ID=CAMNT_0001670499 /DNA_START=1038 /DNA_END=2004 /DNA_ORIENTATION=-